MWKTSLRCDHMPRCCLSVVMNWCWRGPAGCLWLVLASLLQCLRSVAMQTDTNTTPSPSLLLLLCSANTCRNGQCYIVQHTSRCVCETFYRGDHCEHVNLGEVTYIVIGSMVIFQWKSPPRLKGYAFVYYESDSPEMILFKRNIYMRDSENTVIVGNLKGSHTLYQVCIEDEEVAEQALSTQSLEYITNCIQLQTQPDYHTLAGWVFAIVVAIVIVLLMYYQRDKMEILYFSKPVYIPKALQDSLAHNTATTIQGESEMTPRVSNGTMRTDRSDSR